MEKAKQQDIKAEPDFSYLQNIKIAVSIIHLLSTYINTALIPLASSSLTVRREMVNYSSTNISNLEKKVNSIFQMTHDSTWLFFIYLTEAIVNTTTYRLSRQRKTDFRLRDDDTSITNLQTEVNLAIVYG